MQTLTTAQFNKQYPDVAFDNNKGFVTFDDTIAVWGAKKQDSINFYNAELAKNKPAVTIKDKAKAKARAIKEKATMSADQKPEITLTADKYDRTRFNISFKVGDEQRSRNASAQLVNSLLNSQQRAKLANIVKDQTLTFEINKFDFKSILVANGKRPGIVN